MIHIRNFFRPARNTSHKGKRSFGEYLFRFCLLMLRPLYAKAVLNLKYTTVAGKVRLQYRDLRFEQDLTNMSMKLPVVKTTDSKLSDHVLKVPKTPAWSRCFFDMEQLIYLEKTASTAGRTPSPSVPTTQPESKQRTDHSGNTVSPPTNSSKPKTEKREPTHTIQHPRPVSISFGGETVPSATQPTPPTTQLRGVTVDDDF